MCHLGANLDQLEANFGQLKANLVPTWGQLGLTKGHLGANLGLLRANLGPTWATEALLGDWGWEGCGGLCRYSLVSTVTLFLDRLIVIRAARQQVID